MEEKERIKELVQQFNEQRIKQVFDSLDKIYATRTLNNLKCCKIVKFVYLNGRRGDKHYIESVVDDFNEGEAKYNCYKWLYNHIVVPYVKQRRIDQRLQNK